MANKEDRKFIAEAREELQNCVSDEHSEREKMQDDLRFCTLDQWPADIRRERERDPNGARPCLTIDKINQYIVQVVNDERKNKPGIKVRPVDDKADPATAKIFQGLIRHIEDRSSAGVAYQMGGESAIKIGLGYWRVTAEYADRKGEGERQELCIKPIPNTFSVYLGRHIMPDGSDARSGYIVEQMSVKEFKKEYPEAKVAMTDFAEVTSTKQLSWRTEDTVTVFERYWFDGSQLKWAKMTGVEVLDKRDLPGKYIPIVEVVGRESYVNGRRVLWGLVRPAKDSLRMNNYWMSAITEKIGLAPKVPFVGAKGQFEGVEAAWKNANRENRAYLEYQPIDVNGNALPPPQRVAPAPVEVAMVNMTALIERDVKAALGMYKAAVGESESQQSGRAILALQKESDTGTLHFSDNQNLSIRHTGRIIVDLAPHYCDTRQVLRILGEDGEAQAVTIDPTQKDAHMRIQDGDKVRSIYNLGVGTYDVTVTVGPSYSTQRQEAATILTELANSAKDPASAAVMRYLAVKNSDFHGSEEMTRMLKALLPAPLQQAEGEQQQIPPQVQAQMQQMQQLLQAAIAKVKELESGEAQAQAKIAVQAKEADSKAALQRQQAFNDANFERWKAALDAKTKVVVAQIAAKQANDEVLVKAENEANIEFMHAINENDIAKMEAQVNADAGEEKGEAMTPQPAPNLRDMMMGLGQMISQMAQMNQQMMQMQQQNHQDMMQMMMKPKHISGKMPSGATVNMTVN